MSELIFVSLSRLTSSGVIEICRYSKKVNLLMTVDTENLWKTSYKHFLLNLKMIGICCLLSKL